VLSAASLVFFPANENDNLESAKCLIFRPDNSLAFKWAVDQLDQFDVQGKTFLHLDGVCPELLSDVGLKQEVVGDRHLAVDKWIDEKKVVTTLLDLDWKNESDMDCSSVYPYLTLAKAQQFIRFRLNQGKFQTTMTFSRSGKLDFDLPHCRTCLLTPRYKDAVDQQTRI
jgi:hypothetical protein